MLALAVLTIVATSQRSDATDLIPITVPEARRLINAIRLRGGQVRLDRVMAWSTWRRRQRARARDSHYKRRHQHELER